MRGMLILGDQLFPAENFLRFQKIPVFMAEDFELCSRYKCHKHKIVFFLSAMRHQCELLRSYGMTIDYNSLDGQEAYVLKSESFEAKLTAWIRSRSITELLHFEIVDSFLKKRITILCHELHIQQVTLPSPMFLDDSREITAWMSRQKRPFMKTYYEARRVKTSILMDEKSGKAVPRGGQFSFDADNRLALPRGLRPPDLTHFEQDETTQKVKALVAKLFYDHVGKAEDFWIPVSRLEALQWLSHFFDQRFAAFGSYEDALSDATPWLYHSVLSPLLNSGLLTPAEVISGAVDFSADNDVPLNSLEGFIRQILGWREFVRGIYLNFEDHQHSQNFFNHTRSLSRCWWEGTTGLLLLDRAIHKALQFGYCHHIERLMVIGNVMLLCQVAPKSAYAWFMELFVDSADWVMTPNVFGMALFSDGGVFATKPYICGSNYWLKMSGERREPWCDDLDSLYWNFVNNQREFLLRNVRTSMMVRTFDKFPTSKKAELLSRASVVIGRLTLET